MLLVVVLLVVVLLVVVLLVVVLKVVLSLVGISAYQGRGQFQIQRTSQRTFSTAEPRLCHE